MLSNLLDIVSPIIGLLLIIEINRICERKQTVLFLSCFIVIVCFYSISKALQLEWLGQTFLGQLSLLNKSSYLLLGPFYWLFVYTLCQNKVASAKHVVHLIPFILIFLFAEQIGLQSGNSQSKAVISRFSIFPLMVLGHFLLYLLPCLWLSIAYYHKKKYSDNETPRSKWKNKKQELLLLSTPSALSLTMLLSIFSTSMLWIVQGWPHSANLTILTSLPILTVMLALLVLFYNLTNRELEDRSNKGSCVEYECFENNSYENKHLESELEQKKLHDKDSPEQNKKETVLKQEKQLNLDAPLINKITKNKFHLKAELSLESLAKEMKLTRHQLSNQLNNQCNGNFYQVINLLRVMHAVSLFEQPQNNQLQIIQIAYLSGFNSKTTFNNAFKRIIGQTPRDYRKSLSHETK